MLFCIFVCSNYNNFDKTAMPLLKIKEFGAFKLMDSNINYIII
jgi:hypothetical protein